MSCIVELSTVHYAHGNLTKKQKNVKVKIGRSLIHRHTHAVMYGNRIHSCPAIINPVVAQVSAIHRFEVIVCFRFVLFCFLFVHNHSLGGNREPNRMSNGNESENTLYTAQKCRQCHHFDLYAMAK